MKESPSIRTAFDKAALHYDAHASQQMEILQKLARMLARHAKSGDWVLDAGCGTGALKRHKPDWQIIGADLAEGMCRIAAATQPVVVSDFTKLSFKNNSFDAVFNSTSLQWVDDIKQTFVQFNDILNDSGYLAISCYLDGTLHELEKAYQAAQLPSPVQTFPRLDALSEALESAGFELHLGEWETRQRHDTNLMNLANYLRIIGAHTPRQRQRGLMTPRQWKALEEAYARSGSNVTSTWNVGYLIAKKTG